MYTSIPRCVGFPYYNSFIILLYDAGPYRVSVYFFLSVRNLKISSFNHREDGFLKMTFRLKLKSTML